MDFLKALFGGNALTYEQFEQAINAHNGNEANKENQIKIGNLGTGKYVDKGKFDNLQALLTGKENDLTAANNLIEQLKKGTQDSEALQNKVSEYEKALADSAAREAELKIKYALDIAMRDAGVQKEDAELLSIALERKLKEKGEKIELDDNGSIKGWNEKLEGLKTQYPNMFGKGDGGGDGDGFEPYDPKGLPNPSGEKTVTKDQFKAMTYEERVKLKQSNEKLYNSLKG